MQKHKVYVRPLCFCVSNVTQTETLQTDSHSLQSAWTIRSRSPSKPFHFSQQNRHKYQNSAFGTGLALGPCSLFERSFTIDALGEIE